MASLPWPGLLNSPCLVWVTHGTAYIPVINVGTVDHLLFPCTSLGTLGRVVSLPVGVMEVKPVTAVVLSQAAAGAACGGLEDLSALTEQEQTDMRSLLQKYQPFFANHDGDLGCTSLNSREIPLLDDAPVTQQYRRVPTSEEVKAHINQLLEAKVI